MGTSIADYIRNRDSKNAQMSGMELADRFNGQRNVVAIDLTDSRLKMLHVMLTLLEQDTSPHSKAMMPELIEILRKSLLGNTTGEMLIRKDLLAYLVFFSTCMNLGQLKEPHLSNLALFVDDMQEMLPG